MIILCFIAFLIYVSPKLKKSSLKKTMLFSGILGVILTIINSLRPLAPILIIALFIFLFLIHGHIKDKSDLLKKTFFFICTVFIYVIFGILSNQYMASRLGQPVATLPAYNIYVGFNLETNGQYSQDDMNLLAAHANNASAPEAQKAMMNAVINRIKNTNYNLTFFDNKINALLSNENACVLYGGNAISHPTLWSVIAVSFYNVILIYSFIGCIVAFIKREKSIVLFSTLFLIGLTAAHMFVEVAARYHYSIILSLTILSAYVVDFLFHRKSTSNPKASH